MSEQTAAPQAESADKTTRLVIFVVGAWNMISWLLYLPGLWVEDEGPMQWYVLLHLIMTYVVSPLVSAAGLILAYRNEKLKLAGILVAIPWAFFALGLAVFAAGVAIHGF